MHTGRILALSTLLDDQRLQRGSPAAVILRTLVTVSGNMADEMNDTANDGENSKCPTGDDYNELSYLIDVAGHVLDQIEAREKDAAACRWRTWRRLRALLPVRHRQVGSH